MARYKLLVVALLLVLVSGGSGMSGSVAAGPTASSAADKVVDGVACSQARALGIDRQMNLHASYIMVACGLEARPLTDGRRTSSNAALPPNVLSTRTANYGGLDVHLSTDSALNPLDNQFDSMVSGNGNTIVVADVDTHDGYNNCYSSIVLSTNGGVSFLREGGVAGPLCNGHGDNVGSPIVVFNAHLGKWFAGGLVSGCGQQGVGIWSSSDARNWTAASPGCALNSNNGDRESMWVDNNPASSHYGRMYVSFNDFALNAWKLEASYSDNGATWSAPVVIYSGSSFQRNQSLTGSQGSDGSVYVAAMDEGGGGLGNRQNYMYKSTDGGATFSQVYAGPVFPAPGSGVCQGDQSFAVVNGNWRYMGQGQPAASANGVVAFDYGTRGSNSDDSDIYFVRSTDYGATWSAPIKLNSDNTSHEQWLPSLSASPGGALFASWYDRRNTTDGLNYQYYGRLSTDGGATWQADMPVSDNLIAMPGPLNGSPNCYQGDYNYQTTNGNTALVTWLEARTRVLGGNPPNLYFDKVDMAVVERRR